MSEIDLERAAADALNASEQDLRSWAYRALFHRCWSAIVTRKPLTGIDLIGFDALISSAIACPLQTWCVRAIYYRPRFDDEWDTNTVTREAPWLRDCFGIVGGLVRELQMHKSALLSCDSEDLARGLFLASQPEAPIRRRRRLAVQLFSDRGYCVGSG